MNIIAGRLFGTIRQIGDETLPLRLPECAIDARKCCPSKLAKKTNFRSGV